MRPSNPLPPPRWAVTARLGAKDGSESRYGKMAGDDLWWLIDLDGRPLRSTDDPGWLPWLVDEELDPDPGQVIG